MRFTVLCSGTYLITATVTNRRDRRLYASDFRQQSPIAADIRQEMHPAVSDDQRRLLGIDHQISRSDSSCFPQPAIIAGSSDIEKSRLLLNILKT